MTGHDDEYWACAMSEKGTLGQVRMEALSAGIFAFAMTLVAVDFMEFGPRRLALQ
jgi:hypothetical protein